jgi:hypothetical protein
VDESSPPQRRLRELAAEHDHGAGLLMDEDGKTSQLPPRFVLSSEATDIAQLLDAQPAARWLLVAGALPDRFLRHVLHAAHRRHRELVLVVADPTRVFLSKRGPSWYGEQGVHIRVLRPIALEAITVNPVAPQSHRFDSAELRALLAAAVEGVPIFDVMHADYAGLRQPAPAI